LDHFEGQLELAQQRPGVEGLDVDMLNFGVQMVFCWHTRIITKEEEIKRREIG